MAPLLQVPLTAAPDRAGSIVATTVARQKFLLMVELLPARDAIVTVPPAAGLNHLVNAVIGKGRHQAGNIAVVLGNGVSFPFITNLAVKFRRNVSTNLFQDSVVAHLVIRVKTI